MGMGLKSRAATGPTNARRCLAHPPAQQCGGVCVCVCVCARARGMLPQKLHVCLGARWQACKF